MYNTLGAWKGGTTYSNPPAHQRFKAEKDFLSFSFYARGLADLSSTISLYPHNTYQGIESPSLETSETFILGESIALDTNNGLSGYAKVTYANSQPLVPGTDYVLTIQTQTSEPYDYRSLVLAKTDGDAYLNGGIGLEGDKEDLAFEMGFLNQPFDSQGRVLVESLHPSASALDGDDDVRFDFDGLWQSNRRYDPEHNIRDYFLDRRVDDEEFELLFEAPPNKYFFFKVVSTEGNVNESDFGGYWNEYSYSSLQEAIQEGSLHPSAKVAFYNWDQGYGMIYTGSTGNHLSRTLPAGGNSSGGYEEATHIKLENSIQESVLPAPQEKFKFIFFDSLDNQSEPFAESPEYTIAEIPDIYAMLENKIESSPATTNITNNTTNNTTVNISNTGSGDVIIGDIGVVNNTTNIDNSFTIQTTNINLSLAITGDSKKGEKVEGTDGDDLIADGRGKDKLIGGDGADQFYFAGEEPFKKKIVDKVIDFDASEGDAIVIADEVVDDLTEDPTLAIADTKKDLKQLSKDGYDLLYFEPKGDLYVDGNGDSKGFGKKSEGGMIADLPKDTILTDSDVLIGV